MSKPGRPRTVRDAAPGRPLIRAAGPGDADAMADTFIHAWRHAYPGVVPDAVLATLDHAQTARWLTGLIERPAEGDIDVAEQAGRVIGFVRYGSRHSTPADGYVFGLYVHPDQAGHGTGQALLGYAESQLRQHGCRTVCLHVFEANNRARRLYAKAGYVPDGSTRVEPAYQATEIQLVKAL